MKARRAAAVPVLATLVVGVIGLTASPAYATQTISTGEELFNECDPDGNWAFEIDFSDDDIAAGIEPPDTIDAELSNGGSVVIDLDEFVEDAFIPHARYVTTDPPDNPTGDATATIDAEWEGVGGFLATAGACHETHVTLDVSPQVFFGDDVFTVSGQLTAAGEPVANSEVTVRLHSNVWDGAGAFIDTPTDGDGTFQVDVEADSLGFHQFHINYSGTQPGGGELGESPITWDESPFLIPWALPEAVPDADGPLASSEGDTFADTTVVSGEGFAPLAEVAVVLYPTQTLLAATTADQDGAFEVEVSMPAGVTGEHTLAAIGTRFSTVELVNQVLALPVTISALDLPDTVPDADGTLTSSEGNTFTNTTVVSGAGFEPNTEVAIALYSTPTLLAVTTADDAGEFEVEVTAPAGVTGEHRLVAFGQAAGSLDTRVLTLAVTIGTGSVDEASEKADSLPVTGSTVAAIAVIGALLLGAGATMMMVSRRRRLYVTAE